MSSLKTIQTLAKVGKVLSTIIFVICIVGLVLCTAGAVLFTLNGAYSVQLNTVFLKFIEVEVDVTAPVFYAIIAAAIIALVIEMILCASAKKYFRHELEDGTPFTERGAQELKSLGIRTIVLPLVGGLVYFIGLVAVAFLGNFSFPEVEYTFTINLGLGITMLVVSALCRYGAALEERVSAGGRTDL